MTGKSECLTCGMVFIWRKSANSKPGTFCRKECMNKKVKTWCLKDKFIWSKSTKIEKIAHLKEIFEKNVIKIDGCWNWKGKLHGSGYAVMNKNYVQTGAHRISYLIHIKDPGKKLVLHKCDVKHCTNPEHLFLGTYKDNAIDRSKKGRGNTSHGENHINAKLTSEKVREIRNLLNLGVTMARICRDFNMSSGAINAIKKGLTWKHVIS